MTCQDKTDGFLSTTVWVAGAMQATSDRHFMLDSGATVHIANTRTAFDTYRPFTNPKRILVGKRGEFILAHGEGTITSIPPYVLKLENVWFCPEFPFNVVSTHQLTATGMKIEFIGDIAIVSVHGECLHKFAKETANGLCVSSSFVNNRSLSLPPSRPLLCFGAVPLPGTALVSTPVGLPWQTGVGPVATPNLPDLQFGTLPESPVQRPVAPVRPELQFSCQLPARSGRTPQDF
jgi:hypothetical protein